MNRTGKAALWLLVGHAAVFAIVAVWAFTQPEQPPAHCAGDTSTECGFSPRFGAVMFLFLYCLPAVTLSLLGSLVAVGIVAGLKRHRAHDEPE